MPRCSTPNSVPCACASVHISRRVSFDTSRYAPTLNPCSVSSTSPITPNSAMDVHPMRRWRNDATEVGVAERGAAPT